MRWWLWAGLLLGGCASAPAAPISEGKAPRWLKRSISGPAPARLPSCDYTPAVQEVPCTTQRCTVTRRTQLPFGDVRQGALARNGQGLSIHLDTKGGKLLLRQTAAGWEASVGAPGDVRIQPYGDGRLLTGSRYLLRYDALEAIEPERIDKSDGPESEPTTVWIPGPDGRCAFYETWTAAVAGTIARKGTKHVAFGREGKPGVAFTGYSAGYPLLAARSPRGPRFAYPQMGRIIEVQRHNEGWDVREVAKGHSSWTLKPPSPLMTSLRSRPLRYIKRSGRSAVLLGAQRTAYRLKKCAASSCGTKRSWSHDALWLRGDGQGVTIALDDDQQRSYRVLDAVAAPDGTLRVLATFPTSERASRLELLEVGPELPAPPVEDEALVTLLMDPPPVVATSLTALRRKGFLPNHVRPNTFSADGAVLRGHDRLQLGRIFLEQGGFDEKGGFIELRAALPASLGCAGTKLNVTLERGQHSISASLNRLQLRLRGAQSKAWEVPNTVDTTRLVTYRLELRGAQAQWLANGQRWGSIGMRRVAEPVSPHRVEHLDIAVDGQGPQACSVRLLGIDYGPLMQRGAAAQPRFSSGR